MNKQETIEKIAVLSQVATADCEKVVDALEVVLGEELGKEKGFRNLFDLLYNVMTAWKSRGALLLLCLILSSLAYGQAPLTQTIRGVVTNRLSGAVLPAVSIQVVELPHISGQTDKEGHFMLPHIPIGRYSIKASSVGFKPTMIKEVLLSAVKEPFLEIAMDPVALNVQDVRVVSTNSKEQASNKMALAGGRTLRVEEASRYAGGMDDPARLLSSFAGISANVGNNGVSVHGNAPSLLQWRLEGVEIPNPNHFADIATLGGGVLSALSANVLGNSDFYSGAFPAEYSNAVSGVFDMKMRNGNSHNYEHTFQLGLLGMDFASEGPFRRNSPASYLFNYRYSTTGLMNKMSSGATKDQLLDYQDLNFKLNFPSKNGNSISVWGTGLIDKFVTQKEDPQQWEYIDDSKFSEMKQTSGAAGISHRYALQRGGTWHNTFASIYSKNNAIEAYYKDANSTTPYLNMDNRYINLVFTSSFDKKYSAKHTNKTGVAFTHMNYNMDLGVAPFVGKELESVSQGKGNTNLISAYSSSLFALSSKVSTTIGVNGQILTLNNQWTIEPRLSIRWQSSSKSSLALAYGLHSRMEKMDVYYVKDQQTKQALNKELDFTKTHHVSLSYQYKITENMNLKVEPYFQYLFDVPVIADSSYSVLNRSLFYVQEALVNTGKGRNYGLDLTLEKYLTKGLYYMVTASVFDSRYSGGNGVWFNTKYNRRFVLNGLVGKEWTMGGQQRNLLSVNLKLTLQGGNRYTPVDEAASLNHPDKEIQYDETKAYSRQFAPMFLANYSISYRMNRSKRSHEFAVKWLNASRTKEYYEHAYSVKNNRIEAKKQATSLFNVLYRIDF